MRMYTFLEYKKSFITLRSFVNFPIEFFIIYYMQKQGLYLEDTCSSLNIQDFQQLEEDDDDDDEENNDISRFE